MNRTTVAIPALMAFLLAAGCGVKVTTGQSAEEASLVNEERARAMKSQFAEQFLDLRPSAQGDMLIDYFRRVGGGLVQFGRDISNQWRQGEQGRGETIEASEMREQVRRWTTSEKPILRAWEENLEFGLRRLREQHYYGERAMTSLREMVDYYYDAYSEVVFPNGTREEYESTLYDIENQIDELADDAGWAVERDH